MNIDEGRFARLAGWTTILAAPLAWASLVLGLSAAQFDFEALSNAKSTLELGVNAIPALSWSYTLSMLGSYLLLIPIMLWWYAQLKPSLPQHARLYLVGGLGYAGLGAAGAAIFATVWALLLRRYAETTDMTLKNSIIMQFETVTSLAQGGLQGTLQNLLGSVWWFGIGWAFLRQWRTVSITSLLIASALLLNAVGNLFNVEVLSMLGLIATLILAPIWGIMSGISALRQARNG